jgi:hypothetical protein
VRYLLTIIAGIALAIAWSTMWNLLLGLPMTFFRLKEKDRIRIRERQIGMGQLRWILTVGVLRSGLASGLAVVTFDLLLDRSPHDWHYEAARFVLISLFFGFFSGGTSWDVTLRETPPSPLGPPPPQSKR